MREILFRGKRIDNGEWVEGYYLRDQYHIGGGRTLFFIGRIQIGLQYIPIKLI